MTKLGDEELEVGRLLVTFFNRDEVRPSDIFDGPQSPRIKALREFSPSWGQ